MGRKSFVQLMVNQLVEYPREQASGHRLALDLGWDQAKVDRVVAGAQNDPSVPISRGPGGVVRYRGTERGAEVGIYHDVKRVIESYWARGQGLRDPEVTVTAKGGTRVAGVWTHPDLVLQALPRRRKTKNDPSDFHSIEVETYAGFDIKSIYQAHAQGRGADFSWVFFASTEKVTPHFERIEWAAGQLGVGLVRFQRSGASTTYHVARQADRRKVTPEDRDEFSRNTGAPQRLAVASAQAEASGLWADRS